MKAARKFRRNTPITKSQKKRDELAANMLMLQQFILERAAAIVDTQIKILHELNKSQQDGMPETRINT